jgi:hypothetical protein
LADVYFPISFKIVVLPGDGIGRFISSSSWMLCINLTISSTFLSPGPEVTGEAVRVLQAISAKTDLELNIESHHFGGAGIDNHGVPLPDSTLDACKSADAVLLGQSQERPTYRYIVASAEPIPYINCRCRRRTQVGCRSRPTGTGSLEASKGARTVCQHPTGQLYQRGSFGSLSLEARDRQGDRHDRRQGVDRWNL